MGKYSGLRETIENECNYEGDYRDYQSLDVSLKVLDVLDENTTLLPVKQALIILDDAKELLLQLIGIN